MESWEIYNYARDAIPRSRLLEIYGPALVPKESEESDKKDKYSERTLYYWAANPDFVAETRRNPIDRLSMMLKALQTAGCGHVARAAIDIMARPLGGQFAFTEKAESDKGTLEGEALDVSIAIGDLLRKCREVTADNKVTAAERAAVLEHMRTAWKELNQLFSVVDGEK